MRARAQQHRRDVEAEARDILAQTLDREPVTMAELPGTDEGAEIGFEPERLGLTPGTSSRSVPV